MEIRYQLFEKENLFIQKFIGNFSIEYYIRYNRYIMENSILKSISKVLIDFRDIDFDDLPNESHTDFNTKLDRIAEIRKETNKNETKSKDVTILFWVDKPLPTVIAHLFIQNFPDMNYHYCSTIEKVLKIIKISERFNNLENVVSNLENTFS